MADEYILGFDKGLTPETIDNYPDLTMSDLLDALSTENIIGGADIMIIGKKVGSGRKTREVGASWMHFEDTEELFEYLNGEYDPERVDDSLEVFQELFVLPEVPEKIVGFVIRPTS